MSDEPIILPITEYFDVIDDGPTEEELAIVPQFDGNICSSDCPTFWRFNGGNPVIVCEKYSTILGNNKDVVYTRCERCIKENG
jgi:hypothetical protein